MNEELLPDPQLLVPNGGPSLPETFGRYRVIRPIGQGAMGAVFLADDTVLERQVALKVRASSPVGEERALERFRREARYAAVLQHPNICPVYDVGEIDGIDYIALAYLDGVPLSQLLAQGPLPGTRRTAQIVRDIASGLQHAHERGVIHRDLKPANIMIDRAERPIIMDFGIATRLTGDPRITRTGALMGTPAYMAHEQIHGNADAVRPSIDIYSLGVILYEMLTGQWPFPGNDPEEIFQQLAYCEPRRPRELQPSIDDRLEAICLKMIARQPEDRYPSMQDVVDDLNAFLAGDDVAASGSGEGGGKTGSSTKRPVKSAPSQGQRILGAAGAILLMSIVGGIVVAKGIGLPQFHKRSETPTGKAARNAADAQATTAAATVIPDDPPRDDPRPAPESTGIASEEAFGISPLDAMAPAADVGSDSIRSPAPRAAVAPVDQGKRWFVGIGIDRSHEKAFTTQPGAGSRIEALATALHLSAGFESQGLLTGEDATYTNIRQVLQELAQSTEPDVTLCLAVDGMLSRVRDSDGTGWDEAFVAFDSVPGRPETFVTDGEFRDLISALPVERLIVLLDLEQPVFAVTPDELAHREPALARELQTLDSQRRQRLFGAVAIRHRSNSESPEERLLERIADAIQMRSASTLQAALEQACDRASLPMQWDFNVYGEPESTAPIRLNANSPPNP